MTRNEQIKEAANQYAEHFPRAKNASFVSFTDGVEWSEQNQGSVDWQQVRIQAAIEMMKTLRSDKGYNVFSHIQIARISVEYADALVKELKGE